VAPWVALQSPYTRTHKLVVILSFTNLFLCGNKRHMAPRTDPHYILRTRTQCPFTDHTLNKDGSAACWILLASAGYGGCRTFAAAALGLPIKLGVGRSWLLPAFSIKFLTRRNLKSQWVHLAPHEDNRIQLLSTVRSRRWKNNFVVHLKLRRHIE